MSDYTHAVPLLWSSVTMVHHSVAVWSVLVLLLSLSFDRWGLREGMVSIKGTYMIDIPYIMAREYWYKGGESNKAVAQCMCRGQSDSRWGFC